MVDHGHLLTPAEVAALFRVDSKTVTRWEKQGKLHGIRTLGGHRRFWENDVLALLGDGPTSARPPTWEVTPCGDCRTPVIVAVNTRGGPIVVAESPSPDGNVLLVPAEKVGGRPSGFAVLSGARGGRTDLRLLHVCPGGGSGV